MKTALDRDLAPVLSGSGSIPDVAASARLSIVSHTFPALFASLTGPALVRSVRIIHRFCSAVSPHSLLRADHPPSCSSQTPGCYALISTLLPDVARDSWERSEANPRALTPPGAWKGCYSVAADSATPLESIYPTTRRPYGPDLHAAPAPRSPSNHEHPSWPRRRS